MQFFQSLTQEIPKLMWLRNNHKASKPTSSAFESADIIFSSSESSSAPVLTATSDAVVALSNSSETQNGEDLGEQSNRVANSSEDVINLTFDDANVLYDGDLVGGNLPASRRDYEKQIHQYLQPLYTQSFKFPYREVTVGGRTVKLNCFHYSDASNTCQPREHNNNRSKKFEFVDMDDTIELYRWELKGCLATYLQQVRKSNYPHYFSNLVHYMIMI